jgi:hypothetical protein
MLFLILLVFCDFTMKTQVVLYDVDKIRIQRPAESDPNTCTELSASYQDWFKQMSQDWLKSGGEPDLNGDGKVDLEDFCDLARHYKGNNDGE